MLFFSIDPLDSSGWILLFSKGESLDFEIRDRVFVFTFLVRLEFLGRIQRVTFIGFFFNYLKVSYLSFGNFGIDLYWNMNIRSSLFEKRGWFIFILSFL